MNSFPRSTLFALVLLLAALAEAAPYSPDPSFGTNGVVTADPGGGFVAMRAAADGKIVSLWRLADAPGSNAGNIAVLRMMPDGALDPAFGISGRADATLSNGTGSAAASAHALELQADGKILIGGFGSVDGVEGPMVLRLGADGAPDAGFGTAGRKNIVATGPASDIYTAVRAIRPLADGRILVAGSASPTTNAWWRFFAARLIPGGSPDPAFGGGTVMWYSLAPDSISGANAIALQSDGKAVLSGFIDYPLVSGDAKAAAIRILADGTLDSAFADGGILLPQAPQALVDGFVQWDGRIVLLGTGTVDYLLGDVGTCGSRPMADHRAYWRMSFMRTNDTGSFDTHVLGSGNLLSLPAGGVGAAMAVATLDPQDRILVAGSKVRSICFDISTNSIPILARFNSQGALDFAIELGAAGTDLACGVAVQPDGKIVVAVGTCAYFYPSPIALHRFEGGGDSPGYGVLGDLDGDGIPDAIEGVERRDALVKDNDIFAVPRLFVMQQYRDLLAREAESGGLDFWTAQVASGTWPRGQLIDQFLGSPEFQGVIAPIARLYFAYFLRYPDYGGLQFWVSQHRAGLALESVSNYFSQSAEFGVRYGSLDNAQFVDRIYRNVLGRAPDPGGLAFWTGELDSGVRTRGQVMLGFSESPEYRSLSAAEVFVTMSYVGMLRRAPDPQGFSFWVDSLDQGGTGLALIYGFLTSPEYHHRFLP